MIHQQAAGSGQPKITTILNEDNVYLPMTDNMTERRAGATRAARI